MGHTPDSGHDNARSIVLFEPNSGGHRLDYCAWIAEYCRSKQIPVVLAMSSQGLTSNDFSLRGDQLADVDTYDLGSMPAHDDPGYLSWALSAVRDVRRAYGASQLIILEGDKLLARLPRTRLARDSSLTVLVMRMPPSILAALRGGVGDLAKFLLAHLVRVAGANVMALVPSPPRSDSYSRGRLPGVPDAVELGDEHSIIREREAWNLDPRRVWFGVFGHVTSRKNPDLVIRALSRTSDPKSCGLLIAGRLAPEARDRCIPVISEFEARGGTVIVADRLLGPAELDGAIAACQVAVLAHSSEGPSGILGKATSLGTRVVAAGALALREYLDAYPSRGAWVPLSEHDLTGAFNAAIDNRDEHLAETPLSGPQDFARAIVSTA